MENVVRNDTKGKWETINANYQLLPRGSYLYHVPQSEQHPVDLQNKKNPIYLDEAQNAVQIARYARADKYASDTFQDAVTLLNQAENYQSRKEWKPAIMTAKEAVQKAESARLISLKTQQQEALDQERQQAAAREAAAKAQAEQESQRAALAAQQRQQAEQQARLESQQREAAEQAKAEADAARAQAAAEARKAQAAAEEADRLRAQAVQERDALRQQLLQQFNAILQTRETARGLVINMSDVLFAVNKFNLTEDARLKLARLSGIIMAHPGLNLRVEGYTDSTGTEQYNEKLSNERADAVRDFLLTQGLSPDTVNAVGYGEQYPVASNDTSAGRAMNRRVQIVVSGEIIGIKIGTPPAQSGPDSNAPTSGGQMAPMPQQQTPPPQQ
jgi:outer membrane protein OmpA-like peptidoglycan-associated protein